jgi:hypothetical protein
MHSHPIARLTPLSRDRLLCRYLVDHLPFKALGAEAGISLRTAYKWLFRYRSGGHTFLVDTRSTPTAERRGPPAPAFHPQEDRQGRRCSPVEGRTGYEVPGPRKAAKPGAQASCAAVSVGEAAGHDSCRHQTAGPVRAYRAPLHRRPSSRLFERRRLREGACRHRRRHASGLCRGPARRAHGHDCRLPGSCPGLVHRAGDHLPPCPL